MRAKILSTGKCLPENIIKNSDLKQFPARVLKVIEQKVGVKERRFAASSQCTSDLAFNAAKDCLDKIGFSEAELDAIILATSSPDRFQPATAARVQQLLGSRKAFAFDVNSVCSGAIYAVHLADCLIRTASCRNVLVIGSEIYSRFLNPNDFSTFPYFGDGAGALLLQATDDEGQGVQKTILKTDGTGADLIQVPAGGTMMPFDKMENKFDRYFKMVGKEVFKFAVNRGSEVINELMERAQIAGENIRYFVTHQANINIITEISQRIGQPLDKFFVNLDKYGNTAAASVLIGLDELVTYNEIHSGEYIVIVAFGGGLSWGATLIRF